MLNVMCYGISERADDRMFESIQNEYECLQHIILPSKIVTVYRCFTKPKDIALFNDDGSTILIRSPIPRLQYECLVF